MHPFEIGLISLQFLQIIVYISSLFLFILGSTPWYGHTTVCLTIHSEEGHWLVSNF